MYIYNQCARIFGLKQLKDNDNDKCITSDYIAPCSDCYDQMMTRNTCDTGKHLPTQEYTMSALNWQHLLYFD